MSGIRPLLHRARSVRATPTINTLRDAADHGLATQHPGGVHTRIPLFNRRVHVWDGTQYDPANPNYVFTTRPEPAGSYRVMTMWERYLFWLVCVFGCGIALHFLTLYDVDIWAGPAKGWNQEEMLRRRRIRLEWQEREILLEWPDEDAEDYPVPASPIAAMGGMATLTE